MPSDQFVRVAVLDESDAVRGSMSHLINRRFGLELVGCHHTEATLLAAPATASADVVLFDHTMMDGRGPGLVRRLKEVAPNARTVAFDSALTSAEFDALADAGGWGFVSKQWGVASLVGALHAVHAGAVVGYSECVGGRRALLSPRP